MQESIKQESELKYKSKTFYPFHHINETNSAEGGKASAR
jgi:hypothetical protein